MDRYLLASYDYTKAKGYILSAGDYYFTIGDNAHDALNNVLAAENATGMTDFDGKPVEGDAAFALMTLGCAYMMWRSGRRGKNARETVKVESETATGK